MSEKYSDKKINSSKRLFEGGYENSDRADQKVALSEMS